MGQLQPAALAAHLQEVADQCHCNNRLGRPELDFFAAQPELFGSKDFLGKDFTSMPPDAVVAEYATLRQRFAQAVKEPFRLDDPGNKMWSERILSTLFLEGDEAQTEQLLSGLSPEFFLQIEWLAGGRFEEDEFLLDPVFEEALAHPDDTELQRVSDTRAKAIIFNFIRDYGNLEYINIGRVPESL